MEIHGKVHCLFEQSGTFKNQFKELGYDAIDYDIQDNFGQTDVKIDLFQEIENGYRGDRSIFDDFTSDDLIIAFFPCVYFSQQNTTFFDGTNFNWKYDTTQYIADQILERSRIRQNFYEKALMMFTLCDVRGLRLIVENPYATVHYLRNNFPYKPALIDNDRQRRGDYFRKPTQYWYVNCEPTFGQSFTKPKETRQVNVLSGHVGSSCDEDRSMISPDYARNFICDFILGKEQDNSQALLF